MSVVKLSDYKVAKQFSADLRYIERIIDLSLRGLENYKKYKPVMQLIADLNNQRSILKAHENTAKKILNQG
jgi:hypothetical protein